MRTFLLTATCLAGTGFAPLAAATAATAATAPLPTRAEVEATIDEAQHWLASKQNPDGTFVHGQFQLGVTALATEALATSPQALPADGPVLSKAFSYILAQQQPDGGIYLKEQGLGTYCTSLTLMALATTHQLESHQALVKKAQEYLFGLQVKEGPNAGGIGYDEEDGPTHQDVPNTSFAVQALAASGVPASDPHLQAALHFLEHCQNLTSVNHAKWVDMGPQNAGGAVYAPNESQANGSFPEPGDTANPQKKLVSTGSMTYELISDYITLDLKPGDPRLDAAFEWCKRHYGFDANPGMSSGHEVEGLLYYYLMMAKTMKALKVTTLTLPDGRTVDWRGDLYQAILKHGQVIPGPTKGMIFMNSAKRWGEGFPHLATAYMIEALKDIDSALP